MAKVLFSAILYTFMAYTEDFNCHSFIFFQSTVKNEPEVMQKPLKHGLR